MSRRRDDFLYVADMETRMVELTSETGWCRFQVPDFLQASESDFLVEMSTADETPTSLRPAGSDPEVVCQKHSFFES